MTRLNNYLEDGACNQARAVMAMIQDFTVESSWNDERKTYEAEIYIARWENCREQGYILSLRNYESEKEQLNIIFFEHRNSDSICCVKWLQSSLNSLTIDNAKFNDVYRDKFDVSARFNYGEIIETAEWIKKELDNYWKSTINDTVKDSE